MLSLSWTIGELSVSTSLVQKRSVTVPMLSLSWTIGKLSVSTSPAQKRSVTLPVLSLLQTIGKLSVYRLLSRNEENRQSFAIVKLLHSKNKSSSLDDRFSALALAGWHNSTVRRLFGDCRSWSPPFQVILSSPRPSVPPIGSPSPTYPPLPKLYFIRSCACPLQPPPLRWKCTGLA